MAIALLPNRARKEASLEFEACLDTPSSRRAGTVRSLGIASLFLKTSTK